MRASFRFETNDASIRYSFLTQNSVAVKKRPRIVADARIWPTSDATQSRVGRVRFALRSVILAIHSLVPFLEKEGLADVHGRFPAAPDSDRDLQHHCLSDAGRFLCRYAGQSQVDVRCGVDGGLWR